jgi:hypothetical protein
MDSLRIFAAFLAAIAWSGAGHPGNVDFAGFIQLHSAARISDVDCPMGTECGLPFNDQRVQFEAEGANDAGTLIYQGKVEFVHDTALDHSQVDVRELFVDYPADRYMVRGGRQVVTWGVGDLLFINDIYPKDWVAFFGGLPLEYLKRGSDAAKLNWFGDAATFELVVSDFRADRLPDARQFVFANSAMSSLPRRIEEPSNPELALKISGQLAAWDSALYASRGYYRNPAFVDDGTEIRGSYPRLNTLGASLSGAFASGVLNLEVGYYDSADDRSGGDPSVDNSQSRFLIGYSRQVGTDTTLGVQAYAEWMHDYGTYQRTLPAGQAQRDRVRTVGTLRLTQTYLHETLRFTLFAFVGLSEDDSYLIPSLRYAFNDRLWAEVGANLFSGSRSGMFGSLGDNDNLYLNLRYSF